MQSVVQGVWNMSRSAYFVTLMVAAALMVAGCAGSPAQSAAPTATKPAPTPTRAPTATAQPTPSPAPSPTPGIAAGLPMPGGLTPLREATVDLKGDGQKQRVVVGAIGATPGLLSAKATELLVFTPVAGGYELAWRSGELAGQRAEGLRVEDINRDGRSEVLSIQSMGAEGQTLYVIAWLGDRFGLLTPHGGHFDGQQSFGENGVRVEDVNGDGRPEIIAAYRAAGPGQEVYHWDGREYYAGGAAVGPTATRAATPGQAPGLTLTLSSRAASYAPGERATFTLVARNAGTTPVSLTFSSAQRFDLVILEASGREIWRWSQGKVFAQVMGTQTLAPGETISFDAQWDQRDAAGKAVPPGNYTARAWLTARGVPQQAQAPFTVRASR